MLELTSLDDVLRNEAAPLAGAPDFVRVGEADIVPTPDVLVADTPWSRAVYNRFCREAESGFGAPTGHLTFENVVLLGEHGLIVDEKAGRLWRGDSLLWTPRSITRNRFIMLRLKAEGENAFSISRRLLAKAPRHSSSELCGAPGFHVYGHWLMDVLPRLMRTNARQPDKVGDVKVHPLVNRWGREIAESAGVADMLGPGVRRMNLARFDRLHASTSLRIGRNMDQGGVRDALTRLKTGLIKDAPALDFGPRIYVSRRGVRRERRPITNLDPFEALLRKAGFREVRPENHSVAEQAAIFSRARDIIGLDGSGLHNSVFASPGARVISVGPRGNLFHLALAHTMDQQVLYVRSAHSEQVKRPFWRGGGKELRATLDLETVEEALDILGPAPAQ